MPFPVDRLLTPSYHQLTPLKDQLKELLEKLDLSTAMKNSPSRSKRLKLLKRTIMAVRSEIRLKNAPPPPPSTSGPVPAASQSEEEPPPEAPAHPLPPPMLELTSPFQTQMSPSSSEPPPLKPVPPCSDGTPKALDDDSNTSTSVPVNICNGHVPDQLLPNGNDYTEPSRTCNRRTNILFQKSKSASPQKPPEGQEASAVSAPPPLGAKTFLSVVIPRLETLLLPKKRTCRSSADSEEDEEAPVKRLSTGARLNRLLEQTWLIYETFIFLYPNLYVPLSGVMNGFVAEEKVVSSSPRLLEPRRRCASESSISSSGSIFCGTG